MKRVDLEDFLVNGIPQGDPCHLRALDLWIDDDDSLWAIDILQDGTCITWCLADRWSFDFPPPIMTQQLRDVP